MDSHLFLLLSQGIGQFFRPYKRVKWPIGKSQNRLLFS